MTITQRDPDTTDAFAIRERLLQERDELTAALDTQRAEGPIERSDVPDGPGETENLVSAEHLEVTTRVTAITQASVDEIDAALARLDRGTYGACLACGRDIPAERLDALPAATHCVACQGAREFTHR